MIRLNRSRFLGIVCLTIFIYFLLFTDSGTSSSEFRANTEAGLARKRQREQELPLRGHLSDEDLTRKTHEELQGILNSPSREGVKKDEHGNTVGRTERIPQHETPSHDGSKKEDISGDNLSAQQKINHDVEGAADANVPQRKTTYKSKDSAVRTEKEQILSSDEEAEREEDPGKAFVMKRLEEYLKNPGMSTK